MTQVAALIWDTFRECRDKKLFWIMLLISTVVAGGVACIQFTDKGIELFFGAVDIEYPADVQGTIDPRALTAALISNVFVALYIGWIGTIIGLVATAGIFPTFLQAGAIDVVLSKPMPRWMVFLGKYLGALTFILFQSAYFIVLTLVVIRFQTGVWILGYLWAIPLLVALFSYIYCVTALAGIWTKSGMGAILVTMIFWAVVWGTGEADALFAISRYQAQRTQPGATERTVSTTEKVVHNLSMVLPRTQDIPAFVARKMGAANIAELARVFTAMDDSKTGDSNRRAEIDIPIEAIQTPSMIRSVGGSLAFEAVILTLACIVFSRRDF